MRNPRNCDLMRLSQLNFDLSTLMMENKQFIRLLSVSQVFLYSEQNHHQYRSSSPY